MTEEEKTTKEEELKPQVPQVFNDWNGTWTPEPQGIYWF